MEALFMDEITKSLRPAFVAGFAVQRTLEILDPLFVKLGDSKKIIFSLISLGMALAIAFGARFQMLHILASNISMRPTFDMLLTGLVIGGGTEGFNSIMKFLSYKKEEKKIDALAKSPDRPEERKALRAAASRI
jgi:hypothetical protein